MNNLTKRIVITGIGSISSLGNGKDALWDGLIAAKPVLTRVNIKLNNKKWVSFLKHKIKNFSIHDYGLDPHVLKGITDWKEREVKNDDLFYLMASAKMAIDDSCLDYDKKKNNIALIATHENPGLEQYFKDFLNYSFSYLSKRKFEIQKIDFYKVMLKRMMKSSFELQTFMPIHHISRILNTHGISFFINNACASGGYAIEQAKMIINSGHSDIVVVVGSDCPDVFKYLWFKKLGMYAENGCHKPFSTSSSGFIMGDASTAFIVESLDHAKKRSAPIYAEYMGGAFSSEGWKVTLPNLVTNYYLKTIKIALRRSGIENSDIDLIIPHGVGTKLSDKFEIATFKKLFNQSNVYFSALKPYFGHNLGGNVLLESAALMLMLRRQKVLQTIGVDRNDLIDNLNVLECTLNKEIKFAMKCTCAFAGFDSALIFKSWNV